MADDVSKGDKNNRRTVFGITKVSGEIYIFRFDDSTGRLLVETAGDNLDVTKAIEDLAQDINAGAYSQTTVNASEYRFVGLFLKFSTTQSRTITLSITNGSVEIPIWKKSSDVSTSRVWVPDKNWFLPADWELKLDITQTSGACSADILLLTRA